MISYLNFQCQWFGVENQKIFSIEAQAQAQKEAEEAFVITFPSIGVAINVGLGSPTPGVVYNKETDVATFTDYDVSSISANLPSSYTTISGTISSGGTEAEPASIFDFTLEGGPVSEISYTIISASMFSPTINVTVTADNKEFDISIDMSTL